MSYRHAPLRPLCARCHEIAVRACPRCRRPLCGDHRACCPDEQRDVSRHRHPRQPRRARRTPPVVRGPALTWRERLAELALLTPLLGIGLSILIIAALGLVLPIVAVLRI
jgi:hypothetical protein